MKDALTPRRSSGGSSTTSRLEGVVFEGHRGWLHLPPVSSPLRSAVVLCQPLGREGRNAYRSLWVLAERLASRGFAVLRYDHCGTGESHALPEYACAWDHWLAGVKHAAKFVRQEIATDALVLGGLRVGASLAAIAAPELNVSALMLLAPVVKGRAWLRELQIETKLVAGRGAAASLDSGLDADGLWLAPATIAELAKFDLSKLNWNAPNVFLASHGDHTPLAAQITAFGGVVRSEAFDGYEDLFKDAYFNRVPDELFRLATDWLCSISLEQRRPLPVRANNPAVLPVEGGEERAECFGKGLRGVLCRPTVVSADRKAVIFVNTGGDPRSGIGGFAAQAAREFCRRGIASLRFDLAGLGDSDFAGDWRSHVYETPREGDFDAAIELLNAAGFKNIVVAGVCSGGYHAFSIASRDPRVVAAYAVNPAVLAWRKGDSLEPPKITEGWNKPWLRRFTTQAFSMHRWRRLLAGEVNWRAVLSHITLRLKRRLIARLDRSQTHALRTRMKRMSKRGGRLRLIMGSHDGSLDELETHFGPDGSWLKRLPGMSVGIIDGLDHGLFFSESRRLALEDLTRYVENLAVTAPSPVPERAVYPNEASLQATAIQ